MIYNEVGAAVIGFGLLAGIVSGGLAFLISRDDIITVKCGMSVLILVVVFGDIWYRAINNRDSGWIRFFKPYRGGMVMFVPLWLVIPALIVAAVLYTLAVVWKLI